MTPIGLPSRISGTPSSVRRRCRPLSAVIGIGIGEDVRNMNRGAARAQRAPDDEPGRRDRMVSQHRSRPPAGQPCCAPRRSVAVRQRDQRACRPRKAAPLLDDRIEHRLEIVGERLMTFSTSLVAVCCSSASVSSRVRACTSSNRRAFSMAMTAWSAKVSTSAICCSVKAGPRCAIRTIAPIGCSFPQKRYAESRAIRPSMPGYVSWGCIRGVGEDILDLDRLRRSGSATRPVTEPR